MSDPKQNLAERSRFLLAYHEYCAAEPTKSVKFWAIGKQLGFDEAKTQHIAQHLSRDGMLKPVGLGGLYAITEKGIQEAEAVRSREADSPSETS